MDGQKEKCCENCKYYKTHFVIYRTRLKEFGGHCTNDTIYRHSFKYNFKSRTDCNLWESNESLIAEGKKRIIDELYCMKKQLDHMILILKEYDET